MLTRAYVLGGLQIGVESLSFHRIASTQTQRSPGPSRPTSNSVLPSGDETEKAFLEATLARHDDNRSAAARELGIARSTLLYKLKKHGIT